MTMIMRDMVATLLASKTKSQSGKTNWLHYCHLESEGKLTWVIPYLLQIKYDYIIDSGPSMYNVRMNDSTKLFVFKCLVLSSGYVSVIVVKVTL